MWAKRAGLSIVIPLTLLAAWFCLYKLKGAENSYITDPREVWVKAVTIRGDLMGNSLLSLRRLMFGVVAGTFLGVLAGITLGRGRTARTLFAPTLNVLTAIPIIVLIPFFLMAFGFGELFRIAVVAAVVLFFVHQAVFSVVRGFPNEWLDLAKHREKTEWQIVREMLLPSALPEIVRVVRLSLLFAWLAIALAEKAVAEWPRGGLGYQILRAREQGLYDELFAAVMVLGAIAWVMDLLLGWLQHHMSHWKGTSEGEP
jgi:ABC-type nitrate/sulfonate/bicarbonate transport system permease component